MLIKKTKTTLCSQQAPLIHSKSSLLVNVFVKNWIMLDLWPYLQFTVLLGAKQSHDIYQQVVHLRQHPRVQLG